MNESNKKNGVSIIIPVYNGEKTIQRCLLSIMNQSSKLIKEIIVVDDGSIDRTSEIIDRIVKQDARIHYIRQKNSGVSSARNTGIRHAHGEFIMFVDGDDEIKKDLVDNLIKSIDVYDMAIAGIELHQDSQISNIGINALLSINSVIEKYGEELPGLLINGPCSKLYRRTIIEKNGLLFDRTLSLGEDTVFVFQYLNYCTKVVFTNYCGYIYYQLGTASLMTKFRKDGYFNAKKVYQILKNNVVNICAGEIPYNFKRVYQNVLMVYIRKTMYNRKLVDKSYIKDIIRDYIEDDIVQSAYLEAKDIDYLQKVIGNLVKKNKNELLYLLLSVHVMIRGI